MIDEEGNVRSPKGYIQTKGETGESRGEIDTEETERIFKCEELIKEETNTKKLLEKLHKYFGHVSPESLYRLLKASSAREKFKQEEIRQVCNNCPTCNVNKRRMNRKKTSLPRRWLLTR